MNYNASSGARHPAQKSSRKKKHVSDTASMGYDPSYNPYMSSAPPAYEPVYDPMSDGRGAAMPPQPSYGYAPDNSHGMYMQANQGMPMTSQIFNDPLVANMARHYGEAVARQYGDTFVDSGKQFIAETITKRVEVSRLKYYFAVDTGYVMKKIGLLLFPYTHSDWSIKYEDKEPVQPRYEINAPDLYIPTMAYLTYVLLVGLVMGTQNRFNPEVLSRNATTALIWLAVEVLVELVTLYLTNIQSNLGALHLIAYGGYKYVGIIVSILLSLVFQTTGYYIGLAYFTLSLGLFLIRALKVQVLPEVQSPQHVSYGNDGSSGHKRRMYFLLFVAGIQPLLMWLLSYQVISSPTSKNT